MRDSRRVAGASHYNITLTIDLNFPSLLSTSGTPPALPRFSPEPDSSRPNPIPTPIPGDPARLEEEEAIGSSEGGILPERDGLRRITDRMGEDVDMQKGLLDRKETSN